MKSSILFIALLIVVFPSCQKDLLCEVCEKEKPEICDQPITGGMRFFFDSNSFTENQSVTIQMYGREQDIWTYDVWLYRLDSAGIRPIQKVGKANGNNCSFTWKVPPNLPHSTCYFNVLSRDKLVGGVPTVAAWFNTPLFEIK